MQRRVKELQLQVDELKELVNTLLSVSWRNPTAFTAVRHRPYPVRA